MFLSRIELPWAVVRNPYDIHRYLWRLFPGETRESRADASDMRQGFLYRVESQATGRPARLILQSRRAPVRAEGVTLLASKSFHPAPSDGQRLAFVLTANAVKTITDQQRDSKAGKRSDKCRVPLIKEADLRAWLARKLRFAANLERVEVHSHPPLYFRKRNRAGKLAICTFEGVLQVASALELGALLENGVGPAKAFGCGLLLVRRLSAGVD